MDQFLNMYISYARTDKFKLKALDKMKIIEYLNCMYLFERNPRCSIKNLLNSARYLPRRHIKDDDDDLPDFNESTYAAHSLLSLHGEKQQ